MNPHRTYNADIVASDKRKLSPQLETFFSRHPDYSPTGNPLLNTAPARRLFDQMQRCVDADLYLFQRTYEERQSAEAVVEGRSLHVFSSYDYLGLIGHPEIDQAAIEAIKLFGTGTGGVRLLTGTNELHDELEHAIRTFKGTESALALTSGYLANLTVIGGLFDSRDVAMVDEFIHRSIIDALTLAGVPCKTFKHNDAASLRETLIDNKAIARRALIIVEGVYSMDGDICPLPEIVDLKEEFGAILMVDEAHSLGVLGKTGRGVDEFFNIPANKIDIFTGSLSKSIPANGGFIAAREDVIHFLKHRGAAFIFSAALSPPNAAAALCAFRVINKENWRIRRLWENTHIMLNGLKEIRVNTAQTRTPIIPIVCGSNENAYAFSKHLYDAGYLATYVLHPAVPQGMARLRICCMATMQPEVIQSFLSELGSYILRNGS